MFIDDLLENEALKKVLLVKSFVGVINGGILISFGLQKNF
jgi:hypothetical protein